MTGRVIASWTASSRSLVVEPSFELLGRPGARGARICRDLNTERGYVPAISREPTYDPEIPVYTPRDERVARAPRAPRTAPTPAPDWARASRADPPRRARARRSAPGTEPL